MIWIFFITVVFSFLYSLQFYFKYMIQVCVFSFVSAGQFLYFYMFLIFAMRCDYVWVSSGLFWRFLGGKRVAFNLGLIWPGAKGFPDAASGKRIPLPMAADMRDENLTPRSGRFLEAESDNPFQYSCLEKSHGQRSLAGYSPWGCKESDVTEPTVSVGWGGCPSGNSTHLP